MKVKIFWLDLIVFAAAIFFIFFSFFSLKSGKNDNSTLIIYSGDSEYVYPLESNGQYKIKGALGESTISVQDGKASFISSPCPNQTCVEMGKISHSGEWAACLPNDIFIMVENKSDGLDALAY